MIDVLKPYPEYKESGLPWLGRIPSTWRLERAKWLFRSRKKINASGAHTNVLSLTLRGVVNNDPDNPEGLVPKDYRTYQLFKKDDLVFKLIDLENLRTSRVGLVHEDGIMSSAYVRLIPNNPSSVRFYFHMFYDLYQRGIYNQLGAGVRSTLGPSDLLNLPIVVPSFDEQAAIVRFLNYASRRLNKTIMAKRKVIALLNKQKQVIIHRVVTSGLDHNAPRKPSGIPWLGDIPEHWDVLRAKYIFHEVDERSITGSEELLSVSHITGVTPRSEKNIMMFKASSYVGHKVCRPGDLVINTMWAWMAALGISKHAGIVSPSYAVYRPRNVGRLVDDYIEYLLRTYPFVSEYICRSTGIRSSRLRLYPEQFFRMRILLPPIEEQKEMAIKISSETADLSIAITRTEREIELLHEYRTRLLADVVTGKLDVREAVRNLPDEAEIQEAPPEPDADDVEGLEPVMEGE